MIEKVVIFQFSAVKVQAFQKIIAPDIMGDRQMAITEELSNFVADISGIEI